MIEIVSGWLENLPIDSALWVVVLVFIVLDVCAGTIKAFLTKSVSSEKARQGIMHKMGYILAMLMCSFIDIAQHIADFGFKLPVLEICAVMIVAAEIFSLCEHIKDLNPDISLDFLHSEKSE